jgi:glyoxylase-like metal-dependent hydrolase (beta-lactamase superfamily II)
MERESGLKMLEISAELMGRRETIYPTIIWDEETSFLIDTGYPGQLPLIRKAMEEAGVAFERLKAVLLTHQDIDHIGNLPAIVTEASQGIEVLSSETERPYIQGEQPLLKHTPEAIEQAVAALPAEVPVEWRNKFRAALEHPPKARVDRIVAGGDVLPVAGGITVISTPGHTPGHISLYHHRTKTLIAGDVLIVADGDLLPSDPKLSHDYDAVLASLRQLSRYDIETVICYHGGLYRGNANERIAELSRWNAASPHP